MIVTMVSFTPRNSDESVHPALIQGKRDSVWVRTRTTDESEIREAAKRKLDLCFGVDTLELSLSNQFES
jgi:hypothetical protein